MEKRSWSFICKKNNTFGKKKFKLKKLIAGCYENNYGSIKENKNYNIANGLKPIRLNWITERQNVIKYKGRKVTYKDNGFLKENSKAIFLGGLFFYEPVIRFRYVEKI